MLLGVAGDKIKQGIYKVYTVVKNGLMNMCYKIYGALHIQAIRLARLIINQYVALKWNIEHLVARCIIAAQLTKVELMIALLNLGAHGQQLLTTVRQIPQRVLSLLKRGK